jgi:uncharacterized protein (TIGR02611 family)
VNRRVYAHLPALRKIAVAVAGFSVLAAGVALIVLPGPAVVVIPIGLAILAREFPWAARMLAWLRTLVRRMWSAARRLRRASLAVPAP